MVCCWLGWLGWLGWVHATSVHQHLDRTMSPVLYRTDLYTSHSLTVTQQRLTMFYIAPLLHCHFDHVSDKLSLGS